MTVEAPVQLDRMALDDAGANPEKLADAIHRQLGERPGPVPIHEIAKALDIKEIREEALVGMEGALVTNVERGFGSIIVNSQSSQFRQRFTVGHELGHFLNPYHQPTVASGFECTRSDMLAASLTGTTSRHQRQEVEANRFAIELLTPRRRLTPYLSPEPDLSHALRLAADFEISRAAACRRYVALHDATLAVVFSRKGQVDYIDRSREFPFIPLRHGGPMPPLPAVSGFMSRSTMESVDASDWIGQARPAQLSAQTLYQQDGYEMTLLLIEADEDSDDGEEPEDAFDRFSRYNGTP